MKVGDKVTRKWMPKLGIGTIKHILGDKIVVAWNNNGTTSVGIEKRKYLRDLKQNE